MAIMYQDLWYNVAEYLYDDDFLTIRLVIHDIPCDRISKRHDINSEDTEWMCKYGFARKVIDLGMDIPSIREKYPLIAFEYFKKTTKNCDIRPIKHLIASDSETSYRFYMYKPKYVYASHDFTPRIYKSPKWACQYCINVLKCRNETAEKIIMTSRRWLFEYVKYFQVKPDKKIDHVILLGSIDNISREYALYKEENTWIYILCKFFFVLVIIYEVSLGDSVTIIGI